jgi:hypothetical protein
MINKLTIEQEQQVKEYYQFYLKKGLSTQPANRLIAEKAVKEMYKLINENEPKCVWVNSPIELINLIKKDNLENNLWNNLRNNLENNLRNNLWNNLWNNLENNLENNLWNNLWPGQFYSSWVGFYEYGRKVLYLKYSAEDNHKLNLWIDMLECSYFVILKGLVILIDHPLEFHIDNEGYTHNASDYAIKFRDSTGIYVLHGQEVTQEEFKDKEKLMKENKISKLEYLEKCYNERY